MNVSVVIKALNEEKHIAASIESALKALEGLNGEVILADSASTDQTVEIAKNYPVTIVQLANTSDRRCGVGPQLGYQYACGDFIYMLDGDMELDTDFLHQALSEMENDLQLGGIAGIVIEKSEANFQFRGRKRRNVEGKSGKVKWLDMGGLYRRKALEEVGYFSNRNLHAFEEQDLGLRLSHSGWEMKRLPVTGVVHHGHTEDTLNLLKRRWRSRYLDGTGEIIRASWRKEYFWEVLKSQKHLLFTCFLWGGLGVGLVVYSKTPWPLVGVLAIFGLLLIQRIIRQRNLVDAFLGLLVWQVSSIALIRGVLTPQVDPQQPIDSIVIAKAGGVESIG